MEIKKFKSKHNATKNKYKKGRDPLQSRIYNRLRYYYWKGIKICCTAYTYLKSYVQSVAIGKSCRFYGVPIFLVGKGGDSINSRIYNRLRYYYWKCNKAYCTAYTYMKACVQSVNIGKGCKFYGIPLFVLNRGGFISIGKNCIFRSSKYNNPLGLAHSCILATSPAHKGTTARITIGDNCGMSGVTVRCFCEIKIGNNVTIGANSLIIDGDAHFDDYRTPPPLRVVIEDDVFIGTNCVVKKGVTIGRGAMIGMNSVVTKDIPSYSVAVGAPARVVRSLSH